MRSILFIRYRYKLVDCRSSVLVPHFQEFHGNRSGLAVADLLSIPFDHRRDFDRAADEHHLGRPASFLRRYIADADGVELAFLDEPPGKFENSLDRDTG